MDKSILENGHTEENKLPKICVNDELVSTSPSPVSVKLNNIEKLDSEGLIGQQLHHRLHQLKILLMSIQ